MLLASFCTKDEAAQIKNLNSVFNGAEKYQN